MTKNKLLSLPAPRFEQEAQHVVGLFGFWKTSIPLLGLLPAPVCGTTWKKAVFEWGPKQKQAVLELEMAVMLLIPFSPYEPHLDMILEVSVS